MINEILRPYAHLIQKSGKEMIPKLGRIFNKWYKIPNEKCEAIGFLTQSMNQALLLLDDIEDQSVSRRGIPSAHVIYGEPLTISAVNCVILENVNRILDLQHCDAVKTFAEQFKELHLGKYMETYWKDNCICPTEEEYRIMATRKTGSYFVNLSQLMVLFSEMNTDLKKLASTLGLYYQIRNDYVDVCSNEYLQERKISFEDLTAGSFSFPLVHAINSDTEDSTVMDILKMKTNDLELKQLCIDKLIHLGSIDYTRDTLDQLESEALKEADNFGIGLEVSKMLEPLNWRKN